MQSPGSQLWIHLSFVARSLLSMPAMDAVTDCVQLCLCMTPVEMWERQWDLLPPSLPPTLPSSVSLLPAPCSSGLSQPANAHWFNFLYLWKNTQPDLLTTMPPSFYPLACRESPPTHTPHPTPSTLHLFNPKPPSPILMLLHCPRSTNGLWLILLLLWKGRRVRGITVPVVLLSQKAVQCWIKPREFPPYADT